MLPMTAWTDERILRPGDSSGSWFSVEIGTDTVAHMRRSATIGLFLAALSVALALIYYLRREASLEEAAIPMAEPPVVEALPVAVPAESTIESNFAVVVVNPSTPVQVDFPSEAGSTQDLTSLLDNHRYRAMLYRTPPRPYYAGCKEDIEAHCLHDRPVLTEPMDPTWSDATAKRLRALWDENVPDLSDEFLFVMCKTTACQVNYRFPWETLGTHYGRTPYARYFSPFMRGFRESTLTSELRWISTGYSGTIVTVDFERIRSQDDR